MVEKKAQDMTVVVVGAGLVGAMTAVFLGRRGYKVTRALPSAYFASGLACLCEVLAPGIAMPCRVPRSTARTGYKIAFIFRN